jgi:hypothetical protein
LWTGGNEGWNWPDEAAKDVPGRDAARFLAPHTPLVQSILNKFLNLLDDQNIRWELNAFDNEFGFRVDWGGKKCAERRAMVVHLIDHYFYGIILSRNDDDIESYCTQWATRQLSLSPPKLKHQG